MKDLKIIAFTHKTTNISNIGKLHVDAKNRKERLENIKKSGLSELMYLSTCNRVEFIFVTESNITETFLTSFFTSFSEEWNEYDIKWALDNCSVFQGEEAVKHMFHIASSLDSLVIGEREIITQVRKAYEDCKEYNVCGDVLRVFIQKTVQTAKKIYTESNIAKNLGQIQKKYKKFVDIGSYPFFRLGKIGVAVVTRSSSLSKLKSVNKELMYLVRLKKIQILKI